MQRGLARRDAAGRLEADDPPGPLRVVADRLEHDQAHARRGAGRRLARRGLDEVRARLHREHRGVADVVVGAELGGLEDHLEVGVAAALLDRDDLLHARACRRRPGTPRARSPCRSRRRRPRPRPRCRAAWPRARPGRPGSRWRRAAVLTPVPSSASRATPTSDEYTQIAATDGISGIVGAGHTALAHRWRTLPAVSAPSSVVRSSIDTARRMPCCLAVVLIERLPSWAARSSIPTRSTWGRRRITPARLLRSLIVKRVLVFCGSSPGRQPEYAAAAGDLGRLAASRGLQIVYGGASVGLMGALADSALAAGGTVDRGHPDPARRARDRPRRSDQAARRRDHARAQGADGRAVRRRDRAARRQRDAR